MEMPPPLASNFSADTCMDMLCSTCYRGVVGERRGKVTAIRMCQCTPRWVPNSAPRHPFASVPSARPWGPAVQAL
jgi:hypothetical protein